MILEQMIIWMAIGGITGLLADLMTSWIKLGLLEAVIAGIVGAMVGGWLLGVIDMVLLAGVVGSYFSAFAGAMVLLLLLAFMKRWQQGDSYFHRNQEWSFVQPFEE